MTLNQIDESATRQRAIIDALADQEELMKPSQLAEATGLEPSNVRQAVREMLDAGLLWQPKYGKYGLPEWRPKDEPKPWNQSSRDEPELFDASPKQTQSGTRGNIGIIFVDVETGADFFGVRFPDYLPVFNPLEVRIRTKSKADANNLNLNG